VTIVCAERGRDFAFVLAAWGRVRFDGMPVIRAGHGYEFELVLVYRRRGGIRGFRDPRILIHLDGPAFAGVVTVA
jgi:hypothetical protein